jgi:biotin transport system substrate-specific component
MVKETRGLPLRVLVYASLFGALTAVGAYISIPLYPVPVTLQTMFTILAGLLLTGRTAALSQVVYVLLGVIGLPVFSGGKAGLGVLFGPTGGYLIGFVIGALVVGWLRQTRKDASWPWHLLCAVAGIVVIYGIGVLRLTQVAHLSLSKGLIVGALPFLPGDAVKCAVSVLVASRVVKHRRIRGEADLP